MHSLCFLRNMSVPEFFRRTAEFFCGYSFQFSIFNIVHRQNSAGDCLFSIFRIPEAGFPRCGSAWERRKMNYEVFRSAVLELLEEDKEWEVETDWEEKPDRASSGIACGTGSDADCAEDFIEMEQEKGAIYEFVSVSVSKLFLFYRDEGWDAVVRELERHTRRGRTSLGRNRGIDYTARLDENGKELYERLRKLRSEIAMRKQLPSYFIFTNRTLYEMCCRQPGTMEELLALYGVGEKNSREYGQSFLEAILEFKGEIMK